MLVLLDDILYYVSRGKNDIMYTGRPQGARMKDNVTMSAKGKTVLLVE